MLLQTNYTQRSYIFLQTVLLVISPLTSLLVSIRYFKYTASQVFIVLFAFYFGYHYSFVHDLMRHYMDMIHLYPGRSLIDVLNDKRAYLIGADYYHIFYKYIFTRFSTSHRVFGGVTCAIHFGLLLFVLRQFKEYYKQRELTAGEIASLVTVACAYQFVMYQGIRFWVGCFFFLGFYLKYVNTGKIRYLIISCFCFVAHFSLFTLTMVAIVEFFIKSKFYKTRFVILITALCARAYSFDFRTFAYQHIPFLTSFGNNEYNEYRFNSIYETTLGFRENVNKFYEYRNDFIIALGFIVLFFLYRRHCVFPAKYHKLFCFFLTLFTIVNFGYSDHSFFWRFEMYTIMLLYSFIFIVLFFNHNKLNGIKASLFILIFLAASYAILTAIVQQRNLLFDPEMILGNVFIDYDGTVAHPPT